jgi:hypothetical protein
MMLALCYYWFAVADRYTVFLYYHDMGQVVPDTSPFSAVTASRYWMSSLVASGAVMMLYALVNCLLGRVVAGYTAPTWWRVWALSGAPLIVGLPLITMTVNDPTLPAENAAHTTLAALIGLALALLPGKLAAERPGVLLWLAADGWWVMLILVTVAGLQNLPRWLATGGTRWVWMSVAVLGLAVAWLLLMTALRFWRRRLVSRPPRLLIAGLCEAYLLLPLAHHVCFTDGHYYITNSNNFLADSIAIQLAAFAAAAGTAVGITQLRRTLAIRHDRSGNQHGLTAVRS